MSLEKGLIARGSVSHWYGLQTNYFVKHILDTKAIRYTMH